MPSISSRRNPLVLAFRELARAPDATGARLLLDGVHLVRDAHASGAAFDAVALADRAGHDTEAAALARALEADGVDVVHVDDRVLDAMSPVRSPSGIAAIVRRRPADAAAICRHPDAFVLIADNVQDPGNLGSLIRAAEAGGATGVLVCGHSASPFSWKAVRGSMGSILRLPVAAGLTADDAVDCIARGEGRVIAAVPRGGDAPDAVDWRRPVALLLGGEGPGLGERALARSHQRVTIPMAAPVESLNVAVAAGILVYAARRQRA